MDALFAEESTVTVATGVTGALDAPAISTPAPASMDDMFSGNFQNSRANVEMTDAPATEVAATPDSILNANPPAPMPAGQDVPTANSSSLDPAASTYAQAVSSTNAASGRKRSASTSFAAGSDAMDILFTEPQKRIDTGRHAQSIAAARDNRAETRATERYTELSALPSAALKLGLFFAKSKVSQLNPYEAAEDEEDEDDDTYGKKLTPEEVADRLENWFDGTPRGADVPTGKIIRKDNAPKECLVFTAFPIGNGMTRWAHHAHPFRMKYGLSSQNPRLILSPKLTPGAISDLPSNVQLDTEIRREHLEPLTNEEGDKVMMTRARIPKGADKKRVLETLLQMQMVSHGENFADNCLDLIHEYLVAGDKEKGSDNPYVEAYMMKIAQDAVFPENNNFSDNLSARSPRGPIRLLILRLPYVLRPVLDKFWEKLMNSCVESAYPFYMQHLQSNKKNPFVAAVEEICKSGGDALIPLPPWMMHPKTTESEPRVSSHGSVSMIGGRYLNNLDYKMALSIAELRDFSNVSQISAQIFSKDKHHTLHIDRASNGQVIGYVAVSKHEGIHKPPMKSGFIQFEIYEDGNVEMEDTVMDATPNVPEATSTDADATLPDAEAHKQPAKSVPSWKAEVLEGDRKDNMDFQVGFQVKPEDSFKFTAGAEVQITIQVLNNPLPTIRKLKAISHFSRALASDHEDYALQQEWIGTGVPVKPMTSIVLQCDSARDRTLVKEYLNSRDLNPKQTDAALHSLYSNSRITGIQGPPGTGKTRTDGVITTAAVVLYKSVLLCAPSNQPVLNLIEAVILERDLLGKLDLQLPGYYDIVHFPKMSHTHLELLLVQPDMHKSTNKVRMWYYIWKWISKTANGRGKDKTKKEATQWIKWFDHIQNGNSLRPDDQKSYLKAATKAAKKVLKTKRQKIVISTCNNAWQLKQWGVKLGMVVGDEWAFGTEAERLIPLCLGVQKVVESGDHKQLPPTVTTVMNEYQAAIDLSPFERLTSLRKDDVIMLDVNYRMHPEICRPIALLSYGWLGSGPNTMAANEVSRAVDAFWKSGMGEMFQRNRDQKRDGSISTSWRRLYFDIPQARSAPAPGNTSLRNFAVTNMICTTVLGMLAFGIPAKWISIIAPYRDDKELIMQQLALQAKDPSILAMLAELKSGTNDAMQGHENEIGIYSDTPANEHNGANLGFLARWNRMNVGQSRTKVSCWTYGNMRGKEQQLNILFTAHAKKSSHNWALWIMDVIDQGDRIPVNTTIDLNILPKNAAEAAGPRSNWSRVCEHMSLEESEFKSERMRDLRDSLQGDGYR
jgi:hypothetical protein